MKSSTIALIGLIAIAGRAHSQAAHAALSLRSATPIQTSVPCYAKFELALDLAAGIDNPFDPEQIDVQATFTSPDRKTVRVNGFLDQPFTRKLEGGAEKIERAGEPIWKIRFAPDTMGKWHYQVFAKDRNGSAQLPEAPFEVTTSSSSGFIRRNDRNPHAFAYDNGRPFFAVGENMCWSGGRGTFDYDDWLAALSTAGGNWIRIWMCSWNCALEWSRDGTNDWRSGGYSGVGFYSLRNAWKLDTILDACERHGIAVMLCFGTYGEFSDGGFFNEGQWKANPYHVTNGGPCLKAEDFWTNERARKLYQRRLRYLTARYGNRTCIQSWEFWNEAKAPAPWLAEMARFLKGTGQFKGQPADPYRHLVTTTYGDPEVWHIPEIDFSQTHSYFKADQPDHAPKVHADAREHAAFGKPHLVGEFGIDWRAPDTKYDPDKKGVNLHNALWASAVSGDAGGAMIWWWDNYIHPSKLYGHFTPLRRFADTVSWTVGEWKPLAVEAGRVNFYGLVHEGAAMFWAQNPEHNWKSVFEKKSIAAVPAHDIVLRGLPSGHYTVEWWDTWKGEVAKREPVECKDGKLQLHLPELATDIAARVVPQQ